MRVRNQKSMEDEVPPHLKSAYIHYVSHSHSHFHPTHNSYPPAIIDTAWTNP